MKLLSPAVHGVLDYALAIAFLALPGWLNFSQTAASLSYLMGAVYLAASLITRYPLGVLKVLPFPAHGVLESVLAASWIVMPWLFGFASDVAARNFYVVAGVGLLLAVTPTHYQDREAVLASEERRRLLADRRQQSLPVARNRRLALDDRRVAV